MLFWQTIVLSDVVFSPDGLGTDKYVRMTEDYPCIDILLKPSDFASLATPLLQPRAGLEWIKASIKDGKPVAPASLKIWMPEREDCVPTVIEHDGRHRMIALQTILGDQEVPVSLFLTNLKVSRDQALQSINRKVRSQNRKICLQIA